MYEEDSTIKKFSVKIHGGGTFSRYKVECKWTHHNNAPSCNHFDTHAEKISDEKWEEQETWVVADTRNLHSFPKHLNVHLSVESVWIHPTASFKER